MATEKQARRARDLHQEKLVACGAHALSVEPLTKGAAKNPKSFAVVAWIQKRPGALIAIPRSLEVEEEGKKIRVPLVITKSKPFQLE